MTKRQRRASFTVVELLVVVAIIIVLAALLLPALREARERGKRAVCASNLRQCGIAFYAYASDWNGYLPPGHNHLTMSTGTFFDDGTTGTTPYDLRILLQPYSLSSIWTCPSVGAAPITDPDNTRHWCHGVYYYFPGQISPQFGTGKGSPARFVEAQPAARRVVMQDRVAYMPQPPCAFSFVVYHNHGRGWSEAPSPADNPSWKWYVSTSLNDVAGANLLFYDCHVEWVNGNRLVDVGEDMVPGDPCGNGDVMSVMP